MRVLGLALAGAVCLCSPAMATTISTLGDQDNGVTNWGLPDTVRYGQTVTFASSTTLNSFEFVIDDTGAPISYNAYVYAWDTDHATGASLFSVGGATSGVSGYQNYTINTGALALSAGTYVLFLEATSDGSSVWGSVTGSDPYAARGLRFPEHAVTGP